MPPAKENTIRVSGRGMCRGRWTFWEKISYQFIASPETGNIRRYSTPVYTVASSAKLPQWNM